MRDDITGREVARLGDATDHGGEVIEAAPNLQHHGVPVMLEGHLVRCPKCGGDYPGKASGSRTHNGVKVMFIGDTTACGATLIGA
ncbi:PAAR domain-containing protein [Paraburkholderia bannensis]|uniref:Zn-binding Pro-Ala-Ala-Arg (PAAR) domain-containing protein, incolved in TypeVI secretion n=1 Tax=Paraburkholderia tropica TaxID=92647 RepID=A0AAQ1GAL6_9BURK|nr:MULTISPECIES: PAAR domain-containing protein [Paraburkholderia]RQM50388.1 PAAR domain-containing protein [Paraburkholderia bannensis]RQN40184.1 PAAR domain-containing protein [Paraburkholderia tropica]SEI81114.1 Zn-binding Pro-Ala-Ala-Arg (PAAR) domain-containing protein, incolved in TypeVI secretion [Paraburkholderia tropica]